MEIPEYVIEARKTRSGSDPKFPDDLHMVLGLVTEVGEIADVFKKNMAYGKDVDWINIQEEIGDVMWYIANLCDLHGWDLRNILEANAKKLQARYDGKFSEERASKRNLDRERQILEELGFPPEQSLK